MAHIHTPPIDPLPDDPPGARQPDPSERRTVLAVLLTGRPTPDDPAVDHFVEFTDQQGMSLDGLWAIYDGQIPVSAILIIPSAGRAAVVFISPIISHRRIHEVAGLINTAIQAQDPGKISLIQSLLDPAQCHERDALIQAGFIRLASLVYMRCACPSKKGWVSKGISTDAAVPRDDHEAPIEFDGRPLTRLDWQEDRFESFAQVIQASYEDTQDCPGLVGIRQIQDIIAGHKAVGRFDPGLWSAFYLDDQPVGVMLLNPLVDRPELELVYLGIAPRFRGKGLASRLMRRAASLARVKNYKGIHLAVDEQNAPAMKLYRGLNYRATGRKVAMIYALPQSDL